MSDEPQDPEDGEGAKVHDIATGRKAPEAKIDAKGKSSADTGDDGESGETEEEEDGQFAMGIVHSPGAVSLSSLMKKTAIKEVEVSLMSGSTPGRGLPDPEAGDVLLVTVNPAKYELVPKREDGRVKKWVIRAHLRPAHTISARQAEGQEAMVAMLANGNPIAHKEISATLERHGLVAAPAAAAG